MLRYLALALVLALFALRLLRGRFGARFLGVSERVLDIAYIAALLITAALSIWAEHWLLLGIVGALLALRLVEALRPAPARRRADGRLRRPAAAPDAPQRSARRPNTRKR
ncbi:hypothetical protein Bequi_07680 [Brachybacterium sp. JHP9]|uniref:DUF1622 domain-containing protein n=1 Tax=Brachybacterium equifaecis TaxID=2910770 RepID=A0ABT0R2Y2_9MICO|nr:hypothetical protein [Brachybacterium equifaecis]MCL6423265.1 hypothetical protein [Brachybacterium equifaecis]